MAKVFLEDLDARDDIAETIFSSFVRRGMMADRNTARMAYNAAEAFLDERQERIDNDQDEDDRLSAADDY